MWPAIGAIGGALIGALGQKSSNDENIEQQREFAQHGIRWKVEDAKAAGLHPLYALGGSGAAFQPSSQPLMTAGEGSRLGQDLGRAAAGDNTSRDVQLAQLELLKSQKNKTDAEAAAIASQEARLVQQHAASKPLQIGRPGLHLGPYDWEFAGLDDVLAARRRSGFGGGVGVAGASTLLPKDSVKFKPDEVTASVPGQPSITAGDHPMWVRHTLNDRGTPVMLPSEQASESLENIPFWLWPSIIGKNISEFGWDWLANFLPEGPFTRAQQKELMRMFQPDPERRVPGSVSPYIAP